MSFLSGLTFNGRSSDLLGIGSSKSTFLPLFIPAVYEFVDLCCLIHITAENANFV